METQEQNIGVDNNQQETTVNLKTSPAETVVAVKRGPGRPRSNPPSFMFLADENGNPQLNEQGMPIKAGKGKPSSKKHYVWLIPPARNAADKSLSAYLPGSRPVRPAKKQKVVAAQTETAATP